MANVRIKDLPNTATTPASDDFVVLDGTTNNVRKLDASTIVQATAALGADNRLVRSDGTGRKVQPTGISVDDSDNVTGVNDVTATELATPEIVLVEGAAPATPAPGEVSVYSKTDKRAYIKDSTGLESKLATVGADVTPTNKQLSNVMSTGLFYLDSLGVNVDTSKLDIGAGAGVVVDNHSDPMNPTRTLVTWSAQIGVSDPYIATSDTTYIAVNSSGVVTLFPDVLTPAELRDYILLGWADHPGRLEDEYTMVEPQVITDVASQFKDFCNAFGAFNVVGNEYSANGTDLKIKRSAGKTFDADTHFDTDAANPHIHINSLESPCALYLYHKDGVGGWVAPVAASGIDPNNYDNGSGTLVTVPAGKWTIQLLMFYAPTDSNDVQYGQAVYNSLAEAQAALHDPVDIDPYNSADTFRGWLIVKQGCTDLSNASFAKFVPAGKLGIIDVSSGGGAGGEINTASNAGSIGVGITLPKLGVDLPFKSIAAGTGPVSITEDVPNKAVLVNVEIPSILFSDGATSDSLEQVTFSASNGVTFGLSTLGGGGGVITASHNGLTSQSNQAFSAGGGSSAFQTLNFKDANGISFSNSNGSLQASYTVPSTAGLLSNINFSAGTTSANLSALTFSNSNGITFGLNGGTVTASYTVPSTAGHLSAINFSAGTTSNNLSALTFSNSNGISFGLNGSVVTGSHNALTTARASTDAVGLNTALTGNGVAWTVNSSGLSLNVPAFLTTARGSTDAVGLNTALTANGVSWTVNSSGISLNVPAFLTTAMASNAATISNIKFSAGTTSNNLSALTFSNSNGISFGLNGSVVTGSHNALTTARASNDAVGLNTALTGNGVAWTVNSSGLSLNVPAFLTTAMASNAATISNINFSAGTTSANLSALTFANANGISFGLNAGTVTASMNAAGGGAAISAGANSQSTGTVNFANSNGISFGLSNNGTLTASYTVPTQSNQQITLFANGNTTQGTSGTQNASSLLFNGAGIASVGMSNGSVIISVPLGGGAGDGYNILAAGTQTAGLSASVVFSNSNNITFGMSNSSVITASVGPFGIGASNLGNTAGSTGTVDIGGGRFVFAGQNGISLSQSTNGSSGTLTIVGPQSTLSGMYLGPYAGLGGPIPFAQSSFSLGQNSLYVWPVQLEDYLSCDHFRMPTMVTNSSSATSSGQKGQTYILGVYSQHATNATLLTRMYSTSHTLAASYSSNVSWAVSYITAIGNSTSYNSETSSSAGINLSSLLHGPREFVLPVSSVFPPGRYWLAMANSSSSVGVPGNILQMSNLGVAHQTFNRVGVATNATASGWHQFMVNGTYSATTGALPNSINFTQVNQLGSIPILFAATGTV